MEVSLENYVTKQDLKEALATQTKEILRHMGAYKEELSSQVKQIAEQFVDVDRKLDSHSEMIAELAVDMTIVKTELVIIKDDIKSIKEDLNQKVDRKEFTTFKKNILNKI